MFAQTAIPSESAQACRPVRLSRLAGAPILTAIPYIETKRERMAIRRRNWIVAGFGSLMAVAFLLGIHLLLKPLPQLVGSLLRKLAFW